MENYISNRIKPPDQGFVFNIQKFSLHDGQGIRTLVFLKGCPLRCKWCSNPESQSSTPELAYNANKCIGLEACGWCLQACEKAAIIRYGDDKIEVDRSLCNNCGLCVEVCPSKAFELFGRIMNSDEIIKTVEEDTIFYARSGGGLTLGGGDPLFQPVFAGHILRAAQAKGIDTAIETAGHGRWEDLKNLIQHLNTIFFDLKTIDPFKHKQEAGVDNRLILENFKRLCREFSHLTIIARTPVIPEFNDTEMDIQAIVNFLNKITGWSQYQLLPYHAFGEAKYRQLGKTYLLQDHLKIDDNQMETLKEVASKAKSKLT